VFLLQLISTVYSVYFTYRQLDRFGVVDFNPLTARKSPAVLVGDTNSQVFKPKQLLSLNKYLLIRIRMEIIGNSVVRRVHWYKIIFLPNLIRLLNQNCSPPTCQARVGTKSEQDFLIRIRMEIIRNSVVRRVHWYKIIFLLNLIRLLNQNCSPPTCQAREGTKSEQDLLIRIRMEIIRNSVVRRVHWYKIIFLPNLIRLLNQNCLPPRLLLLQDL